MLHVILFILKLIGFLILGIIALIVLLIALILLSAFRYQMKGHCDKEIKNLEIHGTFSYLFHLITGRVDYEKEQFTWELKIVWLRRGNTSNMEEKQESDPQIQSEDRGKDENVMTAMEAKPTETQKSQVLHVKEEKVDIKEEKLLEESIGETSKERTLKKQSKAEKEKKNVSVKKETEKQEEKKPSVTDKLKSTGQTLWCTIRKVCDKIKLFIRKKEILMTFITDEIHMAAWKKVFRELKIWLKKWCPRDVQGNIRFGFEEPDLTGKVLALLGMIYPLVGAHLEIRPDFEEVVLDGDLSIQGRMRLSSAAKAAWSLVWNKNVRTTIRDIMKFSFDEGGTGNG